MKYVKVAVDNISDHTDSLYTYVCEDPSVQPGSVVRVPFGKGNRLLTGYVFSVSAENTENIPRLKKVREILQDYTLPEDLISICSWMKEQYVCRYMDGIRCVIPPGAPAKRGKRKDPWENAEITHQEPPELTPEQRAALDTISPYIMEEKSQTFLVNGVTSSGKTELYMRITRQVLDQGKSVIILVPEISLTPQTITRFMSRFGSHEIAVLHSKLTKGQRYDQWIRVRNGGARILIGARSGVFAPFENLGAVIMDEEHEASYKSDMTPKYDAIEVAAQRCRMHGGILVLGSATPSVVSEFRARNGMYKEVFLRKRYNLTPLPEVTVADMRQELKSGNRSIFSRALYGKIQNCLAQKRQVILFLNRRGYSSFVSCRTCGYVLKCPSCDISLTYHKSSRMAECHYCGRKLPVPERCPSCGSPHIRHFGIGTEKAEELTRQTFPQASVARLDLDTAKKKGEAERILNGLRRGKTDILIGTQLVAKGLDIANVGLVGILAADLSLNIPDYRSAERTFQLIVQASGRAGRGSEKGEVVIQTYAPEHNAIRTAAASDYESFYQREIRMRSLTGYPPFTNILRLVFSGKQERLVLGEAMKVYEALRGLAWAGEGSVFSPQPAYMAFLNETWRYHVIIKSPVDLTPRYLEEIRKIKQARTLSAETETAMLVEVDPYSFT